jgi:hypothetical protein
MNFLERKRITGSRAVWQVHTKCQSPSSSDFYLLLNYSINSKNVMAAHYLVLSNHLVIWLDRYAFVMYGSFYLNYWLESWNPLAACTASTWIVTFLIVTLHFQIKSCSHRKREQRLTAGFCKFSKEKGTEATVDVDHYIILQHETAVLCFLKICATQHQGIVGKS